MSAELTILTGLIGALALMAVIRPAMLFEYPVASAMLMWFFLIPQAWRIESTGDFADYDPTLTWGYMILCVVMTTIGFKAGTLRKTGTSFSDLKALDEKYNLDKLLTGATVLVVAGGVAQILTNREAANLAAGEMYSGAIAFYATMSALLIYGASLSWLLYLYTRKKTALAISIVGLAATLPTILFAARREVTFTVAAVIFLGIFFVKKKSISRLLIFPLVFFGAIFVNQAGEIRGYIAQNGSSLIGAISASDLETRGDDKNKYSEVASAVSDIAIASWSDGYSLFSGYYNTLVQLYVPAFIVGHDVKDSLKLSVDDSADDSYTRYLVQGATRTGFSDSFQSFHYLGCLIFLVISYYMGTLWQRAKLGDIVAQLYYMILLSAGLKVFTESTSIFVGVLPLILGSTAAAFWYARRPVKIATPVLAHPPQSRLS